MSLFPSGQVTKNKRFHNIPLLDQITSNTQRYSRSAFHLDFPILSDTEIAKTLGSRGEQFGKDIKYRTFWDNEEQMLIGVVAFNNSMEGPPNSVHGGCIATTVDSMFGWHSCKVLGFGNVTLNLNINYKKFIKLGSIVRIEIRTVNIDGRKLLMSGRLTNNLTSLTDDENTIVHTEATALFYKSIWNAWSYSQAYRLFGPQSNITVERVAELIKSANAQVKEAEQQPQLTSKL
ncbi:acyl-coenzyme A thioesterase [Acrasis kona]|uniref:Acyl-coenzyme A thioesterase THEM4 n=1 Tax=Acrasis kona TaxID=1008807 RepID=A0AAW2ZA65_9EUKA